MTPENPTPNGDPLHDDAPLYDPNDTPPHGIRTAGLIPVAPPPKTNPSLSRRAAMRPGNPVLNAAILLLAAVITVIAGVLYLTEDSAAPAPAPATASAAERTPIPTQAVATQAPSTPAPSASPAPTLPPIPNGQPLSTDVPVDVVASLLLQSGETAPPADAIYRAQNPFTIAPARSRSRVLEYRIQPGDTLEKIAAQFGISQDTIVWNNDGIYVNRLQPGDTLTILPENGILHRVRQEQTVQQIADAYKVSPYAILDSEFNRLLNNANPSTLLPPGLTVMVPGGVSDKKPVYWNPGITFEGKSGGGGGGSVSFGGGPGSCGAQPNVGGTGSLVVPLPPIYVVTRGFTAYHTGIDLSAPTGTTVFAADSGTVIFAGWSNWGYGNSVVIAHGNILTLYGHMSSVSVSCGQQVGRGAPIGAVGNTGNSFGAHLHFEVRIGESPVNPEGYLAF